MTLKFTKFSFFCVEKSNIIRIFNRNHTDPWNGSSSVRILQFSRVRIRENKKCTQALTYISKIVRLQYVDGFKSRIYSLYKITLIFSFKGWTNNGHNLIAILIFWTSFLLQQVEMSADRNNFFQNIVEKVFKSSLNISIKWSFEKCFLNKTNSTITNYE